MSHIRLEGLNLTVLHTKRPEQAIAAHNRRFEMPEHMPSGDITRCLLRLHVAFIGTEIAARWQPEGDDGQSTGRRPKTPADEQRLIFHARCNAPGTYCVYTDVLRGYNCHWLLWMTHPDAQPYSWRCVYGLDNMSYAQVEPRG